MKWTNKKPVKAGWYWWKLKPMADACVKQIVVEGGRLAFAYESGDTDYDWIDENPAYSQWSGPIPEPED